MILYQYMNCSNYDFPEKYHPHLPGYSTSENWGSHSRILVLAAQKPLHYYEEK